MMLIDTRVRVNALVLMAGLLAGMTSVATPPYGDPNQPYDRLPGTLETYHVKWHRPLAGGKLSVLFITPYSASREIVEAAQRLDMTVAWIMNASNWHWTDGYREGIGATPLSPVEARAVIGNIVGDRLNLGHRYDAIVIGKVSWLALPEDVRELILAHVERGTGLVYVCPNRLKPRAGSRPSTEEAVPDTRFTALFETDTEGGVAEAIYAALPMDALPLHVLDGPGDYTPLSGVGRFARAQSCVSITSTTHGEGRIVGLDYFDESLSNGLSPWIPVKGDVSLLHDKAVRDYYFALLSRGILAAARRESGLAVSCSVTAPPTDLRAPLDPKIERGSWSYRGPETVIARDDCAASRIVVAVTAERADLESLSIHYTMRTRQGDRLKEETIPARLPKGATATHEIPLPLLARGTHFVDIRILDNAGYVLDAISRAFRIESALTVTAVATDRPAYSPGERIQGTVTFSAPLANTQRAGVRVVDTWGRLVEKAAVQLSPDRQGGTFAMPVHRPLSRLWDLYADVLDSNGTIDSKKAWVGLPDWAFDDFMWMTIFAPYPGSQWLGNLYQEVGRRYGLNSVFTQILYGDRNLYEYNERLHKQSVSYLDHFGEAGRHRKAAGEDMDPSKENGAGDIAELSRMYQRIAETGELLDPEEFPYRFPRGTHTRGAEAINQKMQDVLFSARFGSPLYVLTGEEYLLGEEPSVANEFSGFAPLTTEVFRDWCREQYAGDLQALNAEWGSSMERWDDVRGILLKDAVEKNQLPRWVDFRYFMRSRIWSQVFVDQTKAMRRLVPGVRTGRVGHDHHDFTRFKDHMSGSKLYIVPWLNIEWKKAIVAEILQSFSGDDTFLMGSASMIRWQHNFENEVTNVRYPWKMLFMGLNGFDWETQLPATVFGGMAAFTPDFSEALPFFENISREVRQIQRGIGKLTITAKPVRSKVAILWSPVNHYISRLLPFQDNGFSGGWTYNIAIDGGAHSDALALFMSLRVRPTMIGPDDVENGDLMSRGFKALVLPYSKGMSMGEAAAIREFVKQGGLVIADNQPATYSEHGRELVQNRLAELFPVLDRTHVARYGQGHAAYLPNQLNGYLARVEKGDYTGSDTVAELLKTCAGITAPIALLDRDGVARRDTFMPLFQHGSTRLAGFLRIYTGRDTEPDESLVRLDHAYHVWDVRTHEYLGYTAELQIRLDMDPRYLALLPANPDRMTVTPRERSVRQGEDCVLDGAVVFSDAVPASDIGQAVHIRVYDPEDKECEHYRENIAFAGGAFELVLPVSYGEAPGRYAVVAEHAITGAKARTWFDVIAE